MRRSLLPTLLALAGCTGWDPGVEPPAFPRVAGLVEFPWQARCAGALKEAARLARTYDPDLDFDRPSFMSVPGDNYTYYSVHLMGGRTGVTVNVTRRDPAIAEDHPEGWRQVLDEPNQESRYVWRREGPFTTAELHVNRWDGVTIWSVLARLQAGADRCIDDPADSQVPQT